MAARGGIARGYRIAAVSFVVACGAFALAAGAPAFVAIVLLVFAISALTSAELVTSAGEWFLSVQLAPTQLSAPYISVFKMSMAVQQAVGPALVTIVLVGWGRLGWFAFALLLAAGTLASRRLGAREIDRRTSPTPEILPSKEPATADGPHPDPRPMPCANHVRGATSNRTLDSQQSGTPIYMQALAVEAACGDLTDPGREAG
jgi:hypothetical protein